SRVAAEQGVVEIRPADAVDAGELIEADPGQITGRDSLSGPGQEIDGDGSCRAKIADPGIAVAGDGVVAPVALEFVAGAVAAGIEAGAAEADGIVEIRGIRAVDGFDASKRIGPHDRSGVSVAANHCPGRHVDRNADRAKRRAGYDVVIAG